MEQSKCYVIDLHRARKQMFTKRTMIRVAGITIVLLAIPHTAFAATGIDVGAERIYRKLINVGKWVIIVKGGIDTIKSVTEGDMQAAKKNFLGYLVTYGILWALPWGMKEIENLFQSEEVLGR